MYNLSRDCQDRLTRQASRLGQWFAAWASLLTSIVSVSGLEKGVAVVQDRLGRHGTQLLAIWAGSGRSCSASSTSSGRAGGRTVTRFMTSSYCSTSAPGPGCSTTSSLRCSSSRRQITCLVIQLPILGLKLKPLHLGRLTFNFELTIALHCTVRWRWQANATRDRTAAEFPSVVEEGVAG